MRDRDRRTRISSPLQTQGYLSLWFKFNSVKQKEDFIVENIRRINMDIEKYKEELEGFTSRVESSFSETQSWKTG